MVRYTANVSLITFQTTGRQSSYLSNYKKHVFVFLCTNVKMRKFVYHLCIKLVWHDLKLLFMKEYSNPHSGHGVDVIMTSDQEQFSHIGVSVPIVESCKQSTRTSAINNFSRLRHFPAWANLRTNKRHDFSSIFKSIKLFTFLETSS